ncbi:MAG TPA: VOC family protein [Myxococcota bacterium]|nr:VOC family protein [Myxococcota bacterium]
MSTPPYAPQRVIPMLVYRDAPAAIEFLRKAFGFSELYRLDMEDGRVGHAELAYEGNVVALASVYAELGFASPQDLPGIHCSLLWYVDDVDAHYRRALAAGATVVGEPTDQSYGDRSYRALDPEGGRWVFATRLREVAPADMLKS